MSDLNDVVLFEVSERIATITLNRPEANSPHDLPIRIRVMPKKPTELILLYVGCGNHRLPGFTHVEINPFKQYKSGGDVGPPEILADITQKLPIPSQSVGLVLSIATLEHLTYPELINHLIECNRILDENHGFVRMSVPDLDQMVDAYLNKYFEPCPEPDPELPCENYTDYFVYSLLYHDHFYLHNFDTLSRALSKTGFGEIRVCRPGETSVKSAQDVLHSAEMNRTGEIILEARKIGLPSVERAPTRFPSNPIARILAKYFNVKIVAFRRRRPFFPQKMWFKEFMIRVRARFNRSGLPVRREL